MTWNIEDTEMAKLAAEVAEMTGETQEVAVREALREKKERLEMRSGGKKREPGSLLRFMETEVWPFLPQEELDQPPMSKREVEEILGYDEEGS